MFNILYAAGGPTADGSLRGIEIRRQGKLIGSFDFYSFINGKTPAPDISLQSGDLIYIPPRISKVIVKGEVRQPAIFELKPDERLDDALRYAGGVKPSGVDQRVQVSTVVPGAEHVLRDVNVKKVNEVKAVPLYDGDEVEIFSVRQRSDEPRHRRRRRRSARRLCAAKRHARLRSAGARARTSL